MSGHLFRKIPPRNAQWAAFTQVRAFEAAPGPEGGSGRGVQGDLVAEAFEAFDRLARHPLVIALVEVLDAEIDVRLLACEQVPEIDHNRVGDDHRGALGTLRADHAAILGTHIGRLGAPSRMPSFHQDGPQTTVPRNGPALEAFASTLVIARRETHPLGEGLRAPKGLDSRPDLAQHGFRRALPDPRMAFNQRLGVGQRGQTPLHFSVERGNLLVERREVLQLRGEKKLLIAAHQPLQRAGQLFGRRPNAVISQRGQLRWVRVPPRQGAENARPRSAQHVADDRTEFDIRAFQDLLNAIGFACAFFDDALTVAGEFAQLALRAVWNETGLEQTVL